MILVILFILTALLAVYQFYKNDRIKDWNNFMKLPGEEGYPIIGNLISFFRKPEQLFKDEEIRNKKYYPVYKLYSLNVATVHLISPEDLELVLSSTKHISKNKVYDFFHNWLGTGLLTSTGAKWQLRRKILTPAFHFNILQEFINIFNRETKNLVKTLENECHKPYIDVKLPITEYTLVSIAETSMGINLSTSDSKEQMIYKQSVYDIGKLLIHRMTRPWFFNDTIYSLSNTYKAEMDTVKKLHTFTDNVISTHKEAFKNKKVIDNTDTYSTKKRMAMLDLLLTYKEQGADISDEGIREEVETFMFEGHDTTSLALCYILMSMANETVYQEEVYNEIIEHIGKDKDPDMNDLNNLKFMERCIKESLRLYPSVPNIGRVSGEEFVTKSGYTIPKGYDLVIHIMGMHRNPAVFENPEKFDPDRFLPENTKDRHPFAYVPFSAGPRNCIGQKFAILELKAALCGILRKFKLEAVDKPEDITYIPDLVLRTNGPIRVKFVKRS